MRLNGVDARLYPLVGPLVMNPAILRQNNNYPFKTLSLIHIWLESRNSVGGRVGLRLEMAMRIARKRNNVNKIKDTEDALCVIAH